MVLFDNIRRNGIRVWPDFIIPHCGSNLVLIPLRAHKHQKDSRVTGPPELAHHGIINDNAGRFKLSAHFILTIFLLGASYPLSTVTTSSLVQIKSESGRVGLVSSAFGSLTLVPSIIGSLSAGFLSEYISVRLLFIVPGFVLLIIFFVMFLFLNEVRKAGY